MDEVESIEAYLDLFGPLPERLIPAPKEREKEKVKEVREKGSRRKKKQKDKGMVVLMI